MASNSESSYGARIKSANDIVSYVEGYTGYNPPREEEQSQQLRALTANIETLNAAVAVNLNLFKTAVNERQMLYNKGENSVELLLSPINKAVAAQYGRRSPEYGQVSAIIKKYRNANLIKPSTADGNGETEEHNSRSQRSFGSKAQYFKDIVTTLSQCNGYASSNSAIALENLNSLSSGLNEANNKVASAYQKLTEARKQRNVAYNDLSERVQRVKSYVSAQYGFNSKEYKLISGFKI